MLYQTGLRGDLLTEKISGLNMPKTGKTINAALNVIAEVTDSNPPTGLISIPIMNTCLRASHMHQLKTHVRQHVTWGEKTQNRDSSMSSPTWKRIERQLVF